MEVYFFVHQYPVLLGWTYITMDTELFLTPFAINLEKVWYLLDKCIS